MSGRDGGRWKSFRGITHASTCPCRQQVTQSDLMKNISTLKTNKPYNYADGERKKTIGNESWRRQDRRIRRFVHVATVVRASENIARGRPTLWIPRGPFKNRNIKQISPPNHLFFSFHYFVLFCFVFLFCFSSENSILFWTTRPFVRHPQQQPSCVYFFFVKSFRDYSLFLFLTQV
jgi:hypothetical protein